MGPTGDPSPWLDPEYLAGHGADIDVLHVHAGVGRLAAAELECWAETVRRLGVPLVVTVHQLRDPESALAGRGTTRTWRRCWRRRRSCSR